MIHSPECTRRVTGPDGSGSLDENRAVLFITRRVAKVFECTRASACGVRWKDEDAQVKTEALPLYELHHEVRSPPHHQTQTRAFTSSRQYIVWRIQSHTSMKVNTKVLPLFELHQRFVQRHNRIQPWCATPHGSD